MAKHTLIDLTGQKFGRLLVLERFFNNKKQTAWKCLCDCGNISYPQSQALRSGKIKSCGCLKDEKIVERSYKHGMAKTGEISRLYNIFSGIKTRCYNTKSKDYKWYGKKGIKMCQEWKDNYKTFYDWSMSNGYTDELSIDRIDSNKDYCPENCRWITKSENIIRSNSKLIEFNGKTMNIKEWAEKLGINYGTLKGRLNRSKWSIEKAFSIK